MTDVAVVGSGPNGLAAAVLAARAGLAVTVFEAQPTVGGGARTLDLGIVPGVRHDLCSAVHPLALASPFFAEFDLAARGVELVMPDAAYAQPLDGRPAGIAYRDLDRTVDELGVDGAAWRKLLGPLAEHSPDVVRVALNDQRTPPAGMFNGTAVRFGLRLIEQGSRMWNRRFTDEVAPAMLTGVSAHTITPLPSLAAGGAGLMLASLAHSVGWPVPVGGSQSIIDAMVADIQAHGGKIEAATPISRFADLPDARAYLFDTTPRALAAILGDRVPARIGRALAKFRYGNAAAKVDFVLSEPVPWRDDRVSGASTVHVGGTRAEMAEMEGLVAAGQHAPRPVVLCSEPGLADPARRGPNGEFPLWSYTHVPAGSTRDMTETITAQIERFAPGFRDVIVASRSIPAAELAEHNANYIGGDIAAGAVTMFRMVARPTMRVDPYRIADGVYLCSSSTPPGPGVHGMAGYFAAKRALRAVFGVAQPISLSPVG